MSVIRKTKQETLTTVLRRLSRTFARETALDFRELKMEHNKHVLHLAEALKDISGIDSEAARELELKQLSAATGIRIQTLRNEVVGLMKARRRELAAPPEKSGKVEIDFTPTRTVSAIHADAFREGFNIIELITDVLDRLDEGKWQQQGLLVFGLGEWL